MSTWVTLLAATYLLITLAAAVHATFRAENCRINRMIADFNRANPRR